jgi:hypothetical protein
METHWNLIRRVFGSAFASSFHYSIATVTPNGTPHVTPIGSVVLLEPGRGIYFEEFPGRMPSHFADNANICVMGVNSGRWFWLRSLLRGDFETPPAVRLYGVAGVRRKATEQEFARFTRRIRSVRFTRGHRMLWSKMSMVRELTFTDCDIVNLGPMTAAVHRRWSER